MQITDSLPLPELLAMLAEECMELGHAALKYRRALDGTNPTPVGCPEALEHLNEEIADVRLCVLMLPCRDETRIAEILAAKEARWAKRLEGRERHDRDD